MSSQVALQNVKKKKKQHVTKEASKQRELGWAASTTYEQMPIYKPLSDKNLCSHYESKLVRRTLCDSGLIDEDGRILDNERNKGKLLVIEQEFHNAEKEERRLQQLDDIERHRHEMKMIQHLLKQQQKQDMPTPALRAVRKRKQTDNSTSINNKPAGSSSSRYEQSMTKQHTSDGKDLDVSCATENDETKEKLEDNNDASDAYEEDFDSGGQQTARSELSPRSEKSAVSRKSDPLNKSANSFSPSATSSRSSSTSSHSYASNSSDHSKSDSESSVSEPSN
jgi:hypothetical protein